jgi:transcriptional regulator with XRE-family HTH domain
MSQERLGEQLGLSYQQVQKYEQGRSRITVELLSKISEVFGVSVSELISPQEGERGYSPRTVYHAKEEPYGAENVREGELLRQYRKLASPLTREFVLQWLRSVVELEDELAGHAGRADSGPDDGTEADYGAT